MALQIRETFINETKGYQFGDSEWYEPWTSDVGRLFRDMQADYGRCVGRAYVDRTTHTAQVPNCPMVARPDVVKVTEVPVGWVFTKRMRYEDARPSSDTGRYRETDYYQREVWVITREIEEADNAANAA